MARGVCPITKLSLQNTMWLLAFWKEPSWTPDFSACTSACTAGPGRLLSLILGWVHLGQLDSLGKHQFCWLRGYAGTSIPEKWVGWGWREQGSLLAPYQSVHTVIQVTVPGEQSISPAYDRALLMMPDTGQCWVTAVCADSQHDPVSLLSASKQALSSQPGTGDNAQQNLS